MTFIGSLLVGLICVCSLAFAMVSLTNFQHATSRRTKIRTGAAGVLLGLVGVWSLAGLMTGWLD